ncbi:glycosyltransferase [Roseomonas sp. KE2513]|uniref:ceramide glucosyltransferase n=1 Tax=Roseomonas sp. KE2513 TaxID=2479202 RepID=UPI0018DFC46B|nr:ceramide glucosyltransferase [Roseomonas sp. KE2513]MBI0535062.1 glycosyltransferase [Roseomonas sp. KE2513]
MSIALASLIGCTLLGTVHLASLAIAGLRLRSRTRLPPSNRTPVSIVCPLCGIEPFIEATLASAFSLEHLEYEILFCVERPDDPVIPVVRRFMERHPTTHARLLVGADPVSGNPKLNNCVKGWNDAQHDWIVLVDSNVLMPPDYLEQLLSQWRTNTGLVCSTPLGTRAKGFWATVECAILNSHQARWQYAGEGLGFGFAQGKSMLWRRSFLEAHGGISALGAEVAEDAAATKLVRRAGRRVHLVNSPFEQPIGRRRAAQVWQRQLRWARLRRITFPLFYAPEVVTGLPLALLLCVLGSSALGVSPLLAAMVLAFMWYGAEAALCRSKRWPLTWTLVAAFPVRDAMMLGVWLRGWTTGSTVWRGNTLPLNAKPALSTEGR